MRAKTRRWEPNMLLDVSVRFPNIGIEFSNLGQSISVFGFEIAYYGMIIAFGMVMGYFVAVWQAKRTGQDKEIYLDLALYAIIISVIGARIYYVIFNWSFYSEQPLEILNIKGGGLAIYGGIIAGLSTAFVFAKLKKLSFWVLADTSVLGLITGQMIGRWGNFFNREAFGDYTNNLFAMQLKLSEVSQSNVTDSMKAHLATIDAVQYVQVHPTFLYESVWNLVLLILLIIYSKHKKFDGEVVLLYLVGYGVGRLWIESLRTDALLAWGTNYPISQAVSIGLIVIGLLFIFVKRIRIRKNK